MGIIAKSKSSRDNKNSSDPNRGMGFLLVFFPEDDTTTTTPPSPPLKSPSTHITTTTTTRPCNNLMKRSNSNNRIITKTQSTISFCLLCLLLTLLLFTLSTFEPTTTTSTSTSTTTASPRPPRRFLSQNPPRHHKEILNWFTSTAKQDRIRENRVKSESFALQGMGRLYVRGTCSMSDLVVCHAVEDMKESELRLFLRVLYRSGLTSRADVVFLFSSSSASTKFNALIQEENDSFFKLVQYYQYRHGANSTAREAGGLVPSFDVTRFLKAEKKETGEPLWGRRIRASSSTTKSNVSENGTDSAVAPLSYGSFVTFEASELDPENSLAGFLDHVPMSLRRWACYPMLLGRVRRNFKQVMLIDPKKLIVLADPLNRVRSHSIVESVFIKQEAITTRKTGKRNSDKSTQNQVNPAILMGGARGIRRFASAMLTEIVRLSMQHKKKNPITESGVLNQLVGNEHMLKNVNLIISTESIPTIASSLTDSNLTHHGVIQYGNFNSDHNFVTSFIMTQICSREVESSFYSLC